MLKAAGNLILDIVLPQACISCGKKTNTNILCSSCKEKIKFFPFLRQKLNKESSFDSLLSAVYYEEPIIQLLHEFKYKNRRYLGSFLGKLMFDFAQNYNFNFDEFDFITYVPLHPLKLREREYNQARILAKELSQYTSLPLKTCLQCLYYKPSQTKMAAEERNNNVEGIYSALGDFNGLSVLLIDDVATTTATLENCSKVLKQNNAVRVTAFSLARSR